MSWLSKALRKGAKYTPGNQIREALHISTDNPYYQALNPGGTAIGKMAEGAPITAGNVVDPGHWLNPQQQPTTPFQPPPPRGLTPNPGTVPAGQTTNLGGGAPPPGRNYTQNPFAKQLALANALRGGQ